MIASIKANLSVYLFILIYDNFIYSLIKCITNDLEIIEPVHEISNKVVCATSKASDQPAHTRSPHSSCDRIKQIYLVFSLEFLSLKGGYRGSSESTHVKIPHCWKSHALAHIIASLTA